MQVKTTVLLTEREETFVVALCHGLKETSAAKAAGWSVGSARQLLLKPHVAAAVRQVAANLNHVVRRIDRHVANAKQG